ncbi:MAG: hypothetical protein RRA94_11295 [Bacteroidota bacterium]|nr:hypothetical protein [Bacteroidota bacterium]
MIAIIIFYIHIIGAVYAFSKGYVEHKLVDAFMSLAFVAIIFSVGWTMAGFIVRFFFPEKGFGTWLDNDTISLILVTLFETVLYVTYFVKQRGKDAPVSAG